MNVRMERVNSEVQKALSDIIRNRLNDPRITEMVSIMKVDVAKDLMTSKIIVSIYGDKTKAKSSFDALVNCGGYIRKELAHDLNFLRVVPQLTFVLDDSMEYTHKMNKILEGLKK